MEKSKKNKNDDEDVGSLAELVKIHEGQIKMIRKLLTHQKLEYEKIIEYHKITYGSYIKNWKTKANKLISKVNKHSYQFRTGKMNNSTLIKEKNDLCFLDHIRFSCLFSQLASLYC